MIDEIVGAGVGAALQPAVQKLMDWFGNQKALNGPMGKSIADDIRTYFDECEKEIGGHADEIQNSAVSSFQGSEEQRQQIELMFQANRELMGIPDANANTELTYFKDILDQFFASYAEDERLLDYKKGAEIKLDSFLAAYKRETLSFITGKAVNREALMNEKVRALEFIVGGSELIKAILQEVATHLKEVCVMLGAPEIVPAIVNEMDSLALKKMAENIFSAFDRMLQKMIDRLS